MNATAQKLAPQTNLERAVALIALTGAKPEWIDTKKKCAAAERRAGVVWDGVKKEYRTGASGALVKSKAGTWGRQIGGGRAASLTAAECAAQGVRPGPGNF